MLANRFQIYFLYISALRIALACLYGGDYLISSSCPVSESMMNPLTVMSAGTRGWVLMVCTVLRTDSGVSLKPSSHWLRSMPHLRMVSSVSSFTPRAIISWWKWSKLMWQAPQWEWATTMISSTPSS